MFTFCNFTEGLVEFNIEILHFEFDTKVYILRSALCVSLSRLSFEGYSLLDSF